MDAQKRRRAQKSLKGRKEGRKAFLPDLFRIDVNGSVCDKVISAVVGVTSAKIMPTLHNAPDLQQNYLCHETGL